MSGPLGLALVALLIAGNGLFVAAEFALVSVRRAQVEDLAGGGDRRARIVLRELSQLSYTLSAAQFGITATSLLLGFIAERALGETIIQPVLDLVGLPEGARLGVAVALAFLLSTITQMVVGELFPKNLAISRPLGVALVVTPLTRTFGLLLRPIIVVFDGAAQWLTRHLFRVEVTTELEGGHSLDELARIIAASGREGALTEEQTRLLRRAVELGDSRAGEVMVPRPDVVWLAEDQTLADLRVAAAATGHSRFPVRGASEDEVRGTVHVKDLLLVATDAHAATSVTELLQPPLVVPESQPLRSLLSAFRHAQRTFAVVVDEFGGTAGIVTVEDVLEVLVGDIEDEFDASEATVRRLGADRHVVRGSLRTERLEELLGVEVPDGAYETVAGFVLDRLGHIPEPGEVVATDEFDLEVTGVEGVRITELTVTDRRTTPRDGEVGS
ncbi:hemolysin family protein [Nitriliruptor alkaliphilus]|uniref:hemolysin family protein n=1 Tax=Nitriliruptor alkaliphilus TaxID=427918 RepID=UPI0006969395|nr:hemolysin family protein [Nitriliruptor alkaliphilus]